MRPGLELAASKYCKPSAAAKVLVLLLSVSLH